MESVIFRSLMTYASRPYRLRFALLQGVTQFVEDAAHDARAVAAAVPFAGRVRHVEYQGEHLDAVRVTRRVADAGGGGHERLPEVQRRKLRLKAKL